MPQDKFADQKAQLTPLEYRVTQERQTERPFSNRYNRHWEAGTYHCVVCSTELFKSSTKFESKSGWPAFYNVVDPQRVKLTADLSHVGANLLLLISKPDLARTEVSCSVCNAHLGHLFKDGPKPTGLRYCINSSSLRFVSCSSSSPSPEKDMLSTNTNSSTTTDMTVLKNEKNQQQPVNHTPLIHRYIEGNLCALPTKKGQTNSDKMDVVDCALSPAVLCLNNNTSVGRAPRSHSAVPSVRTPLPLSKDKGTPPPLEKESVVAAAGRRESGPLSMGPNGRRSSGTSGGVSLTAARISFFQQKAAEAMNPLGRPPPPYRPSARNVRSIIPSSNSTGSLSNNICDESHAVWKTRRGSSSFPPEGVLPVSTAPKSVVEKETSL